MWLSLTALLIPAASAKGQGSAQGAPDPPHRPGADTRQRGAVEPGPVGVRGARDSADPVRGEGPGVREPGGKRHGQPASAARAIRSGCRSAAPRVGQGHHPRED